MHSVLIAHSGAADQTETVARKLAGMLSDEGYLVSFAPVDQPESDPTGYDAVMLVTSLGERGTLEPARQWTRRHDATLYQVRGALVTIGDDDVETARAAVDAFSTESRWHADAAVQVTAVPTARDYGVLASWFAQSVAGSTVAPSVVAQRPGRTTLMDLAAVEAALSGEAKPTRTRSGV